MIERFGSDAVRQIDQRIRELVELNETDSVQFWRDVRAAAEAMLAKPAKPITH